MKFEKLFSPIKIGNLTSRNRIIFPPVSTNLASTTGEVTDDFKRQHIVFWWNNSIHH